MGKAVNYFELSPSHMSPLSPSKEGAILGALRCDGCGDFFGDVCPVNVRVQNVSSGRHGLNLVQGLFDLGVIKKRLLDALDDRVVRQFVLGQVSTEDGRILSDVVTFRIRKRIIVRGVRNASVRYCSKCGAACYFAMGRQYLYPKPDRDAVVFSSGDGGIVIREDYFTPSKIPKLPGVRIVALEVADVPCDGLGILKVRKKTKGSPTRRYRQPR